MTTIVGSSLPEVVKYKQVNKFKKENVEFFPGYDQDGNLKKYLLNTCHFDFAVYFQN